MRKNTTIMISLPSALQRAGIRALLENQGFDVIGETADIDAAARFCDTEAAPALILCECPSEDSPEFARLNILKEAAPGARVALLCEHLSGRGVQMMAEAGIAGLLKTDIAPEALLGYLELLLLGETIVHRDVAGARITPIGRHVPTNARLSDREMTIIQYIADGLSNKEVARILDIADGTVKIHTRNIQRKLKLKNRTQIAVWAVENQVASRAAA